MEIDLPLTWRVANCALASVTLLFLLLDLRVMRRELSSRRLYLTFSLAGFLLALVVGSIENIAQTNPVGYRTALATASCLWCLIGLLVGKDERPSLWKDFPK